MPIGNVARQEIQALIQSLQGVTYASNAAQKSGESFIKTMETLARGRQTLTTFDELTQKFRNVANFAMLSQKELDKFDRTLRRLAAAGQLPFGTLGVGAKGQQNITAGMSGSGKPIYDYQKIFMQKGGAEGIPGGAIAVKNISAELDKYGSSLKNLKQVHVDAASGVTRWHAELKSTKGIIKDVTLVTGSMGQMIADNQRRFRSWGSAVRRDIAEFLKWSIAAAVIYVPLRKLNELFQESISIQTKLADIQIAVGGSASITAKAYKEAADVAAKLGVDLSGVMDGYVLAYRAAGSVIDPTQRATLATKLLADSMILSKLSGMDQAAALDTLVGALRQLNMPLDQGVVLLDKWVAITKVANVDLKTLSESFAITATASENAGLSIDKLNAIIATVAETTILSSTEAGNAVRAFMSGFTREESAQALEQFGISVKNAAGELKSFDQISREIYERRQLGLIDDQAFAKLSETLGGRGARRGAQVQAYLSNLPRVEQLATVSLNAHGDAADALGIQLETLQTAITRLGVAFSNMARALGAEGGFLDLFKNMTNLTTGIVNAISSLTKTLGTATPALLAFAAAMLLLKKNSALQYLGSLSPLELLGGSKETRNLRTGPSTFWTPPQTGGLRQAAYEKLSGSKAAMQPVGQTMSTFFGTGGGQVLQGALTGVMMAALSGSLSGSKQDFGKAGAQVGASIIGTLLAGGNPIGGVIGATIVTSLIDNLINREVDVASAFERVFTKAKPGAETPEEQAKNLREQQTSQIYGILGTYLGQRMEWRGRLGAGSAAALGTGTTRPKESDIEDYTMVLAGLASGRIKPAGAGERSVMAIFSPNLTAKDREELGLLYDQMMEEGKRAAAKAAGPSLPTTFFGGLIKETTSQYGREASGVFTTQKQTVTTQLGKGEAGVRDLQNLLNQESGFAAKVSTVYAAMTAGNKKAAASFKEVAELILKLSSDESNAILDTANSLGEVLNALEALKASNEEDFVARQQKIDLMSEEARLQGLLNQQITSSVAGQKYQAFEQPSYVEVAAGTTPEQTRSAVEEARRLSQIKLESITLDPAEQMKITDEWGKIGIATVDAITGEWKKLPGILEGIDKEILSKQLELAGVLSESMKIGLETPDLASNQLGQLKGNMEYYRKLLMSNPAGAQLLAQEKPEKLAILFSDNIVKELVVSRTLFSLALRDIIKNQEEQLEGIFNIPEGMTAMIPYTGRLYFSDQPINREGAGGTLPELGPPVAEFGTSTGIFSGAVDRFAGLIGATPAGAAAQEAKLTRMEEEFAKQFAPPTVPPDQEAIDRAQRLADISARKEADYIPAATPEEVQRYGGRGGMRPESAFEDVDLGDTLMQLLQEALGGKTIDLKAGMDAVMSGALPGGPLFNILNTLLKKAQSGGALAVPVGDAGSAAMQGAMAGAETWIGRIAPFLSLLGLGGERDNLDWAKSQGLPSAGGGRAPYPWLEPEYYQRTPEKYGGETAVGTAARGGLGVAGAGAANAAYLQPLSLPVTVNTRIINQTAILLDGFKIQQAINERQNTTLRTATRRAGTGGFIVEA